MSSFLLPRFRSSIDPGIDGDPGIAPSWQGDPGFSIVSDFAGDPEFSIASDFAGDPGVSFAPGGLLSGLSEPPEPGPMNGYGLDVMMSPEQIASIDRPPPEGEVGQGHEGPVTNGQADAGSSVSGGSSGTPGSGYVPGWDHVSLAPQDLNPSGLDIPAPAPQAPPSNPDEKYDRGAKAADILGNGIDWWNDQNRILGLHFGQEGPDLLEKYTGPVGKVLVGVENGLKAAGEIKNGAPIIPTVAGAGIKTASTLGAIGLGGEVGGAVGGSFLGPPGAVVGGVLGGVAGGFAPDWVYGHMNNQQVGEAAGRVLDNAGRSYQKYVIDNPYYDPRLAMP